jgi:PTH1 family peptidyl-tRNA hydrolase
MKPSGLIAGLGNPGKKYASTRHNLGFLVLQALVDQGYSEHAIDESKRKDSLELWSWEPSPGERWLLLRPLTYMNRSGGPISRTCGFYSLEPEQVLVVHDELDLPFGRMRFKLGGGLAGHNGLRSTASELGSRGFARLRMGIGRPQPGGDPVQYVLTPFAPPERHVLPDIIEQAVQGIRIFCLQGMEAAMNRVHAVDLQLDASQNAERT